MKISLSTSILAGIAIVSGGIVLLGYFIDLPGLRDLRLLLVDWAVILAAVALLVGVLNLAVVHWKRFRASQKGSGNSLVLMISILVTIFIIAAWGGPTTVGSMWIYNFILLPIETSLLALLAVVLIYAFARMFHRKITIPVLVFAGVVLFVLVGAFTLPGLNVPLIVELRDWITQVWAVAGVRGILLGVALGTIATGLRILLGSDRPYGG
ncbi:MAG: hypothetical protein A2W35_06375 [Chloroflexi bacterium RBG_16_57_11]|nr:MAG: hypothetical protein A2W35_06375 [Chloroflexi bacterium RBG_16_57_11]